MTHRRVLRPKDRMTKLGIKSSAYHEAILKGLIAPTFAILGSRGQGAFEHEDEEILTARAGGTTDNGIREIVQRQIANRNAALADYIGRYGEKQ